MPVSHPNSNVMKTRTASQATRLSETSTTPVSTKAEKKVKTGFFHRVFGGHHNHTSAANGIDMHQRQCTAATARDLHFQMFRCEMVDKSSTAVECVNRNCGTKSKKDHSSKHVESVRSGPPLAK
eukprot:GFYU01002999.1.p2 GENE.GFYU01002999.1~~GFYU01002999.1.p2  ORF type:complete len:124 (-),score=19.87 GFYU01002999.1:173-544(-)